MVECHQDSSGFLKCLQAIYLIRSSPRTKLWRRLNRLTSSIVFERSDQGLIGCGATAPLKRDGWRETTLIYTCYTWNIEVEY